MSDDDQGGQEPGAGVEGEEELLLSPDQGDMPALTDNNPENIKKRLIWEAEKQSSKEQFRKETMMNLRCSFKVSQVQEPQRLQEALTILCKNIPSLKICKEVLGREIEKLMTRAKSRTRVLLR